jgi:hypothetical protein
MHISVYADGYEVFERDVNAHRTGMEVVVLAKKIGHTASKEKPRTKPDQTTGNAPVQSAPPSTPPQNCGPGVVNCNFAPNQGHQDTYFGAPTPPPIASFTQKGLPAIDIYSGDRGADAFARDDNAHREGRMVGNPGSIISIRVQSDFQYPAFVIDCDHPCGPSAASLTRYGNSVEMSHPINYEYSDTAYSSNQFAIKFRVPDGEVGPRENIDLRLRSANKEAIEVTAVTSVNAH